jgi:hypothetical protein
MTKIALKPQEVSDIFGIPPGTLANLRWKKQGPRYFKRPAGRGVFYLLADVQDWLLSHPVQTLHTAGNQQDNILKGDPHGSDKVFIP